MRSIEPFVTLTLSLQVTRYSVFALFHQEHFASELLENFKAMLLVIISVVSNTTITRIYVIIQVNIKLTCIQELSFGVPQGSVTLSILYCLYSIYVSIYVGHHSTFWFEDTQLYNSTLRKEAILFG